MADSKQPTPSETTEAPYGRCKVCGEPIPKYKLDRYTDDLCGHACERYLEGVEAGRRMGQPSNGVDPWAVLRMVQEQLRANRPDVALTTVETARWAEPRTEQPSLQVAGLPSTKAALVSCVLEVLCESLNNPEGTYSAGKIAERLGCTIGELHGAGLQTIANALFDAREHGSGGVGVELPPSDGTVRDLAERLLARLFRQGRIENHGHRMSHQAGKESGCSECRDVNRLIAALAYTAPEQPSANVSPDAPHDEHRRRVRQWWLTEMGDPPSGEVGKSLARLLDEAFDLGVERGRQMAEGKLDIGKLLADAGAVAREAVLREAMDALRGDTTLSLITEPGRQNARAVRVVERLLTPQGTTEEKK